MDWLDYWLGHFQKLRSVLSCPGNVPHLEFTGLKAGLAPAARSVPSIPSQGPYKKQSWNVVCLALHLVLAGYFNSLPVAFGT